MALKKDKEFKGINTPYHKIVDCNVKTGFVGVASYVSEAAATVRNNMMGGRTLLNIDFAVDVENPLSFAYEEIKKSKMIDKEETNWFADSENC